jgi:hypothetical protein
VLNLTLDISGKSTLMAKDVWFFFYESVEFDASHFQKSLIDGKRYVAIFLKVLNLTLFISGNCKLLAKDVLFFF